eukprot:EG_transcript_31918
MAMPFAVPLHLPTLLLSAGLFLPLLAALYCDRAAEVRRRKQAEANRSADRAGRIHAEHRLRDHLLASTPGDAPSGGGSLLYQPIGILESVFKQRNGTPRQGVYVPLGRARLPLRPELNAAAALAGLEQFSHCWLLFVFHANTNAHKAGGAIKAKVKAPRLQGRSVGLFATRTPHRPCNLGLSVAVIDKVENGALHLSSID